MVRLNGAHHKEWCPTVKKEEAEERQEGWDLFHANKEANDAAWEAAKRERAEKKAALAAQRQARREQVDAYSDMKEARKEWADAIGTAVRKRSIQVPTTRTSQTKERLPNPAGVVRRDWAEGQGWGRGGWRGGGM